MENAGLVGCFFPSYCVALTVNRQTRLAIYMKDVDSALLVDNSVASQSPKPVEDWARC